MDQNVYERAKGMHAMSDAEYEQMMREQAPMMVGVQPSHEYLQGMQNANPYRHQPETPQAELPRQSWWKRRDWWRP